MHTVWILWVLVYADGAWRAWEREYASREACEEIRITVQHHRQQQLAAECRPKMGPT